MVARTVVTNELSELFSALSHPHRIRIIEELREVEQDVNSLQTALGVSHSRVSQQLAILRAHKLVVERREGRHHFYRLSQPDLARWLLEGLRFIEGELVTADRIRSAVEEVRTMWSPSTEATAVSGAAGKPVAGNGTAGR